MKKWLFLYFSLCLCVACISQNNLVPNWSFENIVRCPTYSANAGNPGDTTGVYAIPWKNGNDGNIDLFSTCDTIIPSGWTSPLYGVPSNWSGYQSPHTGDNYLGFVVYVASPPNHLYPPDREYPQVKLANSLIQNKKYCISFYTSPADARCGYSTSRMGAYLSAGPIGNDTTHLLNVIPQVENPYHHFLSNYIGWTSVQGVYIANGGENYITIGNFFNDANTDTLSNPSILIQGNVGIYYYLDDVSLVEYDTAYAGKDTNICKGLKIPLGSANSFGASYNWSVLSGDANSIVDSSAISTVYVKPNISTTYVLQKQQCGIFTYDTVRVYVKPTYTANAGAGASICIGDSAVIGTPAVCNWCTYNWQPVQAVYQSYPQLTVYPLASTTYTLSVKDSCFTTYSNVTVNVAYCYSPIVSVPNIFSPNADGINDTWQLLVSSGQLSLINYTCTVYDRWGIKVFDTSASAPDNMAGAAWDGHTTAGLAASEGTYYYVISYTDAKTNEHKTLKGFLELVR